MMEWINPATISEETHGHAHRRKRLTRIRFTLFWTTMLIAAHAQASTLSMNHFLGFNGRFEVEKWAPMTVILENRGRDQKGTLEVVVTSGSEYRRDVHRTTHAMDLELPHHSKQLRSFTIRVDSPVHDLILRFRAGDEVLVSHSIRIQPYSSNKGLAVVADPGMAPDFLSAFPEEVLAVPAHTVELPETWFGYDGVQMLILSGEALNRLRDPQFAALTQWIRQGGYLVTAAGVNYGYLAGKRMQQLLPMTVRGHREFSGLDALEKFAGRKLKGDDPFLVLDVEIDDSDVLLAEEDFPLVIQKKVGSGKIVFLSFDIQNPPFSRWEMRAAFWNRILSLKPSPKGAFADSADSKILDAMRSSIDARFRGSWAVFAFVFTYLCSAGFLFKRLRGPRGSRRNQVIFLLLSIAAFTATGYIGFFLPFERVRLAYNSFFQMNLTERGTCSPGRYIIGLYSIKDTPFDVGFGSSEYPISHLPYEASGTKLTDPYTMAETDTGRRIAGYSKKWSHRFFQMEAPVDLPVAAEALISGNSLEITIDNGTPHEMIDCLAYFDGRFLPLGNVRANEKKRIASTAEDSRHGERFDPGNPERILAHLEAAGLLSSSSSMRSRIAGIFAPLAASKYRSRKDVVFLMGWIQSGIIQAVFKKEGVRGEDLTMINWEIPVRRV